MRREVTSKRFRVLGFWGFRVRVFRVLGFGVRVWDLRVRVRVRLGLGLGWVIL